MLSRSLRTATSRLNQLASQTTPRARTMATLHTKLPLNTGASIRMIPLKYIYIYLLMHAHLYNPEADIFLLPP